LLQAHEADEQRVREAEKNAALEEKMKNARREAVEEHWALGMAIDQGVLAQDHDESEGDVKQLPAKKMPQRRSRRRGRRLRGCLLRYTPVKFLQC
jgi:nucleolar protein 53